MLYSVARIFISANNTTEIGKLRSSSVLLIVLIFTWCFHNKAKQVYCIHHANVQETLYSLLITRTSRVANSLRPPKVHVDEGRVPRQQNARNANVLQSGAKLER